MNSINMYSKEKESQAPPEVPASLNANSFDYADEKRSVLSQRPDTAGSVTPYLGLRARLSQVWFNRWTILLLLVLVRVLIMLSGLYDDIDDSKAKALSACSKVEDIGSAMASMPHYLSVGVNSLAADGITKTVSGLVDMLMMVLTAVEQLILFVINMYVGTYVCLTSAIIHGTLDVGIGAVDEATKVINKAIDGITGEITKDIGSVQDVINGAFDGISKAGSIFGKNLDPPKIDITSHLDDLKNIHVDDKDFVKSLVSLNSSIPTYDDAEKATKQALSIPFDFVKKELNKTYGGYKFQSDIFPVAEKRALTFCSGNTKINDFFQGLYEVVAKAKIAFVVTILVLALTAMLVMGWWEIKRYRREQGHARFFVNHSYDPMDTVYMASRPWSARFGIWLAEKIGAKGKRQLLVRWAVAYATSLPAIFVLSLAIAGYFSCFCQWTVMRAIQKEAPELAHQVGDFAGEVVTTLENVSDEWAKDANSVIVKMNTEINDDVFGWVVNATSAVNNTLNTFTDEIDKGIHAVFGKTILENTITQIVRCLIGLKIEAVEKGLTWVHDHAHITFPQFPNDTFSQGAANSISGDADLTSFLSSPSSVTTDEITSAVDHVINYLHHNIIQEALISTALLLVYVIAVLIGVLAAMFRMVGPDRTRGEGGQRYLTGEGRAPLSPRQAKGNDDDDDDDAAAARFPRFPPPAASIREEKLAQAHPVRSGRGIREKMGQWRSSSHGHFGHVGNKW